MSSDLKYFNKILKKYLDVKIKSRDKQSFTNQLKIRFFFGIRMNRLFFNQKSFIFQIYQKSRSRRILNKRKISIRIRISPNK